MVAIIIVSFENATSLQQLKTQIYSNGNITPNFVGKVPHAVGVFAIAEFARLSAESRKSSFVLFTGIDKPVLTDKSA